MLGSGGIIISLNKGLIDADSLGLHHFPNLKGTVNVGGSSQTRKDTYALFEQSQVVLGKCIGFRNDRDKVDACSESLHDLNVKRLETTKR